MFQVIHPLYKNVSQTWAHHFSVLVRHPWYHYTWFQGSSTIQVSQLPCSQGLVKAVKWKMFWDRKVSEYFSVLLQNLVICIVVLQGTVRSEINNSKSLRLKFNSILISLNFLDLISQIAITPEIICFCDINYIYS